MSPQTKWQMNKEYHHCDKKAASQLYFPANRAVNLPCGCDNRFSSVNYYIVFHSNYGPTLLTFQDIQWWLIHHSLSQKYKYKQFLSQSIQLCSLHLQTVWKLVCKHNTKCYDDFENRRMHQCEWKPAEINLFSSANFTWWHKRTVLLISH